MRTGRPEIPFWSRVDVSISGCWNWTGPIATDGYGKCRQTHAHRIAYILTYGPLKKGQNVLHSCDNPRCCNPDHLRIGTHTENAADMILRKRNHNQKKTQCPSGHPYDETNTRHYKNERICRACDRARIRKR